MVFGAAGVTAGALVMAWAWRSEPDHVQEWQLRC
jgi:hypothetical protein